MSIYVSHISALQCLASAEDVSPVMALRNALPRRRGPLPHGCRATAADLEPLSALGLPYLAAPVHALVPNAASRSACARLTCHVRSGNFPRRSFRPVAAHVFASMPELCFVQMAETFTPARLIRLGMELCGTYGIFTVGHLDFDREHPYTTVARLSRFASEAGSMPGAKKARQAVRHLVPGSASPLETALALLLCLPLSMGGYGLPQPEMNRSMHAKWRDLRRSTDKRYACDLLWPDAAIAVEYESFEHHSKKGKLADDARRRNDLLAHGITIVLVTTRTVQNLIELDQVAQLLARRLGKRVRPNAQRWPKDQHKLHGMLLETMPLSPQHGHRAL